jgi:hypothetical protein
MNENHFEFIKVPKKLIISLDCSYEKIKKDIIKDLRDELFKEYGIDIRDCRGEHIQQQDQRN